MLLIDSYKGGDREGAGTDLEVFIVDGLREVSEVDLSVERKGGGALDQPLNLCTAEILAALRQIPQVHVLAQE